MTTLAEYIYQRIQKDPELNFKGLHRHLRFLYGDRFVSYSTVRRLATALQAGDLSLLKKASPRWPICRTVLPKIVVKDYQLPENLKDRANLTVDEDPCQKSTEDESESKIEYQPIYPERTSLKASATSFQAGMSMSTLLVRSRCPGKLILSGEHATVYGKNAVAITVDLYTEVTVCSAEDEQKVTLTLDSFDFERSWTLEQLERAMDDNGGVRFTTTSADGTPQFVYDQTKCLDRLGPLLDGKSESGGDLLPASVYNACLAFLLLYLSIGEVTVFAGRKALRVEVTSRLPNGAGLGSSSSYIIALARALFSALNVRAGDDRATLNRWAFEVDKIFHGRPSGIDNSICTYGGAILFGQGVVQAAIDSAELSNLADTPVLLVNTNVGRSTKVMVERCRVRMEAYPAVVGGVLESIASLSESLWEALKSGELHSIPTLFSMNQSLLECLDVGHAAIDQVVAIAKRHGLAAKLTGAGGGGCVLIYLGNKTDLEWELICNLQAQGFTTYQVKLGVSGVENF